MRDFDTYQSGIRSLSLSCGSCEGRVVDVRVDTADTVAAAGSDSDVAIFTPAGTPRVADNVVLSAVFFAPTNSSDSVVNVTRAAVVLRDDSTTVVLEYCVTGGNCDIKGLVVEPVQVFSCALGLTVALNSRDALALVVSAILLIGTV